MANFINKLTTKDDNNNDLNFNVGADAADVVASDNDRNKTHNLQSIFDFLNKFFRFGNFSVYRGGRAPDADNVTVWYDLYEDSVRQLSPELSPYPTFNIPSSDNEDLNTQSRLFQIPLEWKSTTISVRYQANKNDTLITISPIWITDTLLEITLDTLREKKGSTWNTTAGIYIFIK